MLISRRQINHFVAEQPTRRMRNALELNRVECRGIPLHRRETFPTHLPGVCGRWIN